MLKIIIPGVRQANGSMLLYNYFLELFTVFPVYIDNETVIRLEFDKGL